ncbi:MAG: TIGR02281 family clan AA aspartic protease [Candidatus Obscuribacterales bacterium]|nr:TIGR02281 family clan AA aspartic protease [Candidatus Obscuribacterales bacterium]
MHGKYQESAEIFEQCANESPNDKEAFFFAAKSNEKAGNLVKAKAIYEEIVEKFPKSSYASDSIALIEAIESRQYQNNANRQPISLPNDTLSVDFCLNERNLTLPVEINNKNWQMILDTGANHSMIGKNHLRQLGLPIPNWETSAYVLNVLGKNPVWKITVDLDINGQNFRNFRMYVTENMPTLYPSLGQNFITRYNFLVDARRKRIHFVKRGGDKSFEKDLESFSYKIPFRLTENDLMIVDAKVNGLPCEMIVDLGASMTVFTRSELDMLGISVPEEATTGTTNTMVGKAQFKKMNLDTVQLGPIQKSNVQAQVHDKPSHNKPLLGLNFFRDLSFYVDFDRSELLIFNLNGN